MRKLRNREIASSIFPAHRLVVVEQEKKIHYSLPCPSKHVKANKLEGRKPWLQIRAY
jgi:hypothetical protein